MDNENTCKNCKFYDTVNNHKECFNRKVIKYTITEVFAPDENFSCIEFEGKEEESE